MKRVGKENGNREDHHDGEDLIAVAQQKLDALIAMEESENQAEMEEEEIDYNKDNKTIQEVSTDTTTLNEVEILETDTIIRDER